MPLKMSVIILKVGKFLKFSIVYKQSKTQLTRVI